MALAKAIFDEDGNVIQEVFTSGAGLQPVLTPSIPPRIFFFNRPSGIYEPNEDVFVTFTGTYSPGGVKSWGPPSITLEVWRIMGSTPAGTMYQKVATKVLTKTTSQNQSFNMGRFLSGSYEMKAWWTDEYEHAFRRLG